jgi:hypothetical protein
MILSRNPVYRISQNGQKPIVDVDQVEAIEPADRSLPPGRWHADEISADALPSRHASTRWGVGIKWIKHPGENDMKRAFYVVALLFAL